MEEKSKKRKGKIASPKRKKKKMKKLKHQQVEEDWGLVDGELEVLEGREEARTRFLQSDLSWASIGSRQTRIRIWSTLELVG